MKFKATEEQVRQMAVNAINASRQFGMGFLQSGAEATLEEVKTDKVSGGKRRLSVDYFNGRMVKFHALEIGDGVWEAWPDLPRGDYQSWCGQYPTMKMLLSSVITESTEALDAAIVEYEKPDRIFP